MALALTSKGDDVSSKLRSILVAPELVEVSSILATGGKKRENKKASIGCTQKEQ